MVSFQCWNSINSFCQCGYINRDLRSISFCLTGETCRFKIYEIYKLQSIAHIDNATLQSEVSFPPHPLQRGQHKMRICQIRIRTLHMIAYLETKMKCFSLYVAWFWYQGKFLQDRKLNQNK